MSREGATLRTRLRSGTAPADVAEILFEAGLRLARLEPASGSLENAFMSITRGTVT